MVKGSINKLSYLLLSLNISCIAPQTTFFIYFFLYLLSLFYCFIQNNKVANKIWVYFFACNQKTLKYKQTFMFLFLFYSWINLLIEFVLEMFLNILFLFCIPPTVFGIFNGYPPDERIFPYMAAIISVENDYDTLKCSGIIISHYWLLTAAHCFPYVLFCCLF